MNSIIKYVENLKQKPEHIRRRFAFLVSFSITFVVLAGWVASYGFKPSGILTKEDSKVDAPVSSLTATVVGAYSDIKSIIFGSNEVEYSSDAIEVIPGEK